MPFQDFQVPVTASDSLHVRMYVRSLDENSIANSVPVLMVHGAVENGRIFYSKSHKGLAPFLAQQGYACYALDLRGRGESTPKINAHSNFGQLEAIVEDIPTIAQWLKLRHPQKKQVWMAHSWGGVLMLALLARQPEWIPQVAQLAFFGTKRRVGVINNETLVKVFFFWNLWSLRTAKKYGYLPAQKLGFGSDDETRLSLKESIAWVKTKKWIDPRDNFDYHLALKQIHLPPILWLTGQNDRALGHPRDVKRLIHEVYGDRPHEFWLLSRQNGFKYDYDHINILTHPEAPQDHFIKICEWLTSFSR